MQECITWQCAMAQKQALPQSGPRCSFQVVISRHWYGLQPPDTDYTNTKSTTVVYKIQLRLLSSCICYFCSLRRSLLKVRHTIFIQSSVQASATILAIFSTSLLFRLISHTSFMKSLWDLTSPSPPLQSETTGRCEGEGIKGWDEVLEGRKRKGEGVGGEISKLLRLMREEERSGERMHHKKIITLQIWSSV